MKISDFKKIIREEVRKAIHEELALLEQQKTNEQIVQEQVQAQAPPQPKSVNTFASANPLANMLHQTKQSMTSEDYRSIVNANSSMVQKPNFASSQASQMGMTGNEPGLDLSQLDFVKNAKAVLDLANEKSRNK